MRLFQEGIKYSEQSFLAAWQKELREMLGCGKYQNTTDTTCQKNKHTNYKHIQEIRPAKKTTKTILRPANCKYKNIRPAKINTEPTQLAETDCKTKLCVFFVLLACRRGCLLILWPDCFWIDLANSKFAKILLEHT